MKLKLLTIPLFLSAATSSYAAWIFAVPDSGPLLASGNTGSFQLTPTAANFELNNAVDGRGFDQAPAPVTFSWDSGDDEISITLVTTPSNGNLEAFLFNLDPDGDGRAATLNFSVRYLQGVTERGVARGSIGVGVNPTDAIFDFSLTTLDANLDLLPLSSADSFVGNRNPTSFSNGSAIFNDVSGDTRALTNPSTRLAFGNDDRTRTIGGVDLAFSDFQNDSTFRITLDGGVSENAFTVVPEPSISLLGAFACFSLLSRRKRS